MIARPCTPRRLSVPGPGVVLTTEAEARAVFVRKAVGILSNAFAGSRRLRDLLEGLFDGRWSLTDETSDSHEVRAAWATVNAWMVGRSTGQLSRGSTLEDSETWFLGEDSSSLPSLVALIGTDEAESARAALESVEYDDDFRDLLPYILDTHGPGSRLSVMKDPTTQVARQAKRDGGVFYTPADVAEYIVNTTLAEHGGSVESVRCLDPACGSGVFLRAMLSVARSASPLLDSFDYVQRNLFGFDVTQGAIEAAAFLLLHDCVADGGTRGLSPWRAWHAVRMNLAVVDALTVLPPNGESDKREERAKLRACLNTPRAKFPPRSRSRPGTRSASLFSQYPRWALDQVFPELHSGADVLVGNPPYASVGPREDGALLASEFASFSNDTSAVKDLYPLFIEMMWRLTAVGHSAAGLVVPLSIAYHRGSQFSSCRRAIEQSGGRWRFAFFDREPHALFGEDVKTRNAVLFRKEGAPLPSPGSPAQIETGPLRKWTSRTRTHLFDAIAFTPMPRTAIGAGIPKLCGTTQAQAFADLRSSDERFDSLWCDSFPVLPSEAFRRSKRPRVYLAGTAYNFLNVFRHHERRPSSTSPMSESRLLAMEFRDEKSASLAFAILSSRLVYWLWHAQADGFHVPRWFVESLPFGRGTFDAAQERALSALGATLWDALQDFQIVSVNGGRQTVAYRPLACERERSAIDALLVHAHGLPPAFKDELSEFVRSTVTVDATDGRRARVLSHFDAAKAKA